MSAIPMRLVGKTNFEGTAAEKKAEHDMYVAGYWAWAIYGALSSFNVLYYFDIYKRQYMDNPHASWDKMAFWTVMGAASFIRLHFNMVGWMFMMTMWVLSTGGWTFPVLHTFFYGVCEVFIIMWLVRIFILIIFQVLALFIDNHTMTHSVFNYFEQQAAWGAELKVEDLYDTLDIELEAFNIIVQGVAFALYTTAQPLFRKQIANSSEIVERGASCQLCFNYRKDDGTVDETQPEAKNKSKWQQDCDKIKNECELEAKREAAQAKNRFEIASSGSTDFIM